VSAGVLPAPSEAGRFRQAYWTKTDFDKAVHKALS
jgi:hypothetical protein